MQSDSGLTDELRVIGALLDQKEYAEATYQAGGLLRSARGSKDRLGAAVLSRLGAELYRAKEGVHLDSPDAIRILLNYVQILASEERVDEAARVFVRACEILSKFVSSWVIDELVAFGTHGRLQEALTIAWDLLDGTGQLAESIRPRTATTELYKLRSAPQHIGTEKAQSARLSDAPRDLQHSPGAGAPLAGASAEPAPVPAPDAIPRTQPRGASAGPTRSLAVPADTSADRVLEIEAGRLAYQIPGRMWVGSRETVEVRLGRTDVANLTHGFVGRGEVRTEDTAIVETMSVSLVCEPGTFEIESRSQRDQLVKPDLVKGTAFHQADYGKWMWVVTPRIRGDHTLLVKVSAAIKDSRGLPTTSSLPDKSFPVVVRVQILKTAARLLFRVAIGIASAAATALVGVLTKDYWWPAIRDLLGL